MSFRMKVAFVAEAGQAKITKLTAGYGVSKSTLEEVVQVGYPKLGQGTPEVRRQR
ncbi:MAG: hypothetical protein LBU79_05595 [Planctomycetota bacterium]|nr:hypothetical protein [Planctomycetota bacterium]